MTSDDPVTARLAAGTVDRAALVDLIESTRQHRYAQATMTTNAFQSADWIRDDA